MTSDLQLQAMTSGLVRHFRDIATTRMSDVPIVNPKLDVEAVGFTRTSDGCLGVLITPWFMNLVLLPCEGDAWLDRPIGSETHYAFASGNYLFHMAGDDAIGRYQTCSLMSPVLEIADQQTAVAIANAALDALHDEQQQDIESSTHAAEIERRWHGEAGDDAEQKVTEQTAAEQTANESDDKDTRLISRRAFLGAAPRDQS